MTAMAFTQTNISKAMFTRDRFPRIQMDPVRKLHWIGLLFTRDRSGTGPKRIQTWTCFFTGPVLDPFGSVPDRFQNAPV